MAGLPSVHHPGAIMNGVHRIHAAARPKPLIAVIARA